MNLISEHLPRLEGEALPDAAPSPPASQTAQSTSLRIPLRRPHHLTPTLTHAPPPGAASISAATDIKQLQAVSDDLYYKLCEMLLWMVHRRVTDSAAWQAAFQCFVAFVTYFGYIDKARCVACPA